jgi:hypothetical protein
MTAPSIYVRERQKCRISIGTSDGPPPCLRVFLTGPPRDFPSSVRFPRWPARMYSMYNAEFDFVFGMPKGIVVNDEILFHQGMKDRRTVILCMLFANFVLMCLISIFYLHISPLISILGLEQHCIDTTRRAIVPSFECLQIRDITSPIRRRY